MKKETKASALEKRMLTDSELALVVGGADETRNASLKDMMDTEYGHVPEEIRSQIYEKYITAGASAAKHLGKNFWRKPVWTGPCPCWIKSSDLSAGE